MYLHFNDLALTIIYTGILILFINIISLAIVNYKLSIASLILYLGGNAYLFYQLKYIMGNDFTDTIMLCGFNIILTVPIILILVISVVRVLYFNKKYFQQKFTFVFIPVFLIDILYIFITLWGYTQ